MPVVTLDAERFSKFIGRSVKIEDIAEHVPWMGVDIEEIGEDSIKIEYNPNRPDLGIITGLAKAYQGLMRQEMGLKSYTTCEGEYRLVVEESVREVRPYVVSAVIKGVPMDEETLKEIILLQEDLHEGLGRQRKRVSIGIHNLDVVRFPVHYYARGGKEVRFIPLDEEREMSLTEILEKTEKGRDYAHIFEGFDLFPLIVDNEGHVLSFPPIINSEYTRLSVETKNLFFDVTATDLRTAEMVLNVLTTSIVDYGGEVWRVSVEGADYNFECPDFSVRENHVEVEEARRMLGLNLSGEEVVECLRACRFDAEILDGGRIRVAIPPYRVDIMHPVDIVEEVAIGYGFWRIEPSFPKTFQIGRKHVKMDFLSTTTEILIGAGFQEVMNLTLSSLKEQFTWMELEAENYVSVRNPKSHEYEILRKWLIPDLLEVLRVSKKEQYPQRIFEVGIAVYRKSGEVREENHLGVALTHWEAGYSDAKSLLDVLHQILDVKTHVEPISHPSFLDGRSGRIRCRGRELGVMGEINPQVLENFQLDHPVVAMEINLDELYDIYLEKELQT